MRAAVATLARAVRNAAAGLGLLAALPCAFAADAARIDFDIPRASLDTALARFAEQSRGHVFYSPALVAHRQSRPLQGRMTPSQALAQLLEGSNLTAVAVNSDTYLLQPAPRTRRARPPAPRPADEPPPRRQETLDLQGIQVTGSRIPRASLETTVPVTVLTREEIESSGFVTLFDLLKHQPGMTGHHAVEAASERQSQSLTSIVATASAHSASLYGLGPRGTLYLIDGKRVADYALPSASLGGLSDLGGIPLSMVERVEIQRGGASAIYGSDAVAGVVNIILKRDYLGTEGSALYGLSERGDAGVGRLSASGGFEFGDSGQLSFNVDRFSQAHLAGDARDWHTADRRRHGLPDGTEELGYRLEDLEIDPFPSCVAAADPLHPACRLDRGRYRSLRPGIESRAASLHWTSALPRDAQLRADLRYAGATTRLDTAPMFLVGNIVPSSDPRYSEDAIAHHAFYELGPISSRTRSSSTSASIGATVPAGRWSLDVEAHAQSNRARNAIFGVVNTDTLISLLQAGRYHIDGRPNAPEVLATMIPPLSIEGDTGLRALTVRANGPLGAIAGRPIQAAVGAEYQQDRLELAFDPYFLEGSYAYIGDSRDFEGRRGRHAAYSEVAFPATRTLSLEAAWRIDRVQGQGASSSPRAGLTWRPTERVLLRGSMGRAFRSPTLLELNVVPADINAGQPEWIAMEPGLPPCLMPFAGDLCRVEIRTASNPGLRPERALFRGAGVVWEPVRGMDLAVDYFDIVRKDEIVTVALADLLAFPRRFPAAWGLDAEGRLRSLDIQQFNLARSDTRGVQTDATWRLRTRKDGTLALGLSASRILDARFTGGDGLAVDRAGYRAPATTALASIQWKRDAWSASMHLRYFSGYTIHDSASACPDQNATAGRCRNPSISTVALGVSYASPMGWRASAFANNLTDRTPVDYDTERAGYNPSLDDPVGRSYVVRLDYRF
ncbi:TonB-dependent receptor [Luteimonas sp. Y-2-2-4F]|nr:TonB-dependent receptor [Luteimonas sp. Y-2-2-4F]